MQRFGRKKKITDYFYSRGTLVFLGVLMLLLSISVFGRFTIEREMAARRVSAEEDLKQLNGRKESLQERVKYLEGERGIEEEIRKNFDVAKNGERVVILIGEDEESSEVVTDIVLEGKWYQFWK